ncbi:hypothetical protein P1X15_20840 [Runella sp. MFBS21]|uniref:hypothetical protein n=1 Tax=Runella sp. MFBS21 TaxID=3034018 RepID=UPI0023F9E919|nr:hypothetical protein [Runella sp. MFBS21]MDF7820079.1 hypothetical protein [Runella sp. MFBS21]
MIRSKFIISPIIVLGYSFLLYFMLDGLLEFIDYVGNEDQSTLGIPNNTWLFYFKVTAIFLMIVLMILRNPKKALQNSLLMFTSIFITLSILEITCKLILNSQVPVNAKDIAQSSPLASAGCSHLGPDYTNVYRLDNQLGILPKASQTFHWRKTCDNQYDIYNVTFSTDSFSRRITPPSNNNTNKYALFFGCSFTFGEGLQDYQTLPFFFQDLKPQFKSYNYAFNSFTTTHMLAHLNRPDFRREITEKEGVAFYVFYEGHIDRNIPSMSWGRSWNGNYLVYDKNSTPKTTVIAQSRPIKYWLFNKAKDMALINLFKIDYPLKITKQHTLKTADIIEDAYHTYVQKFDNNNFFVLVYPGSQLPVLVKQRLQCLNIKILEYTELFSIKNIEYWIKYDGHPNELANRRVAEEIIKDLGENL